MSDLKEKNEKALTAHLLVALVPVYLSLTFTQGHRLFAIFHSQPLAVSAQLAAIGIGPLLCLKVFLSLFASVIDVRWKERLVHLRWNDPLPGSRSNKLLAKDARIDQTKLPPEVEALKDECLKPQERNAQWYLNVYRPVSKDPAILNSHRRYLLYRDASAGVFFVFVISVIVDIFGRLLCGTPIILGVAYLALFVYVSLLIAAANVAGNRMVTGAIANFSKNQQTGGD